EDAVVDDRRRRAAAVPHERVEVGDVDDRNVVAVGEGVAGAHGVAVRGVVLDVDGGHVPARAQAGPLLEERDLVGPLEDDDVAALLPQLGGAELAGVRGPVPRARPAQAVGPAVGEHRDEVLVGTGDEGGQPGPVDVPDGDLHAMTSWGTRDATASTTCSGRMPVRQGWPGTGHSRARVPAHAASWSPRTMVGTP